MPLLDLKTDLKSLKYGQDQPGGGNSGQPYIKTDINTVDSGFNRFRLTKFDDGLIRGGAIGAANAAIVDTLRIGKFFVDFPKGPLFLAKQVGLQLSNPKLQHIDILPTNKKGKNLPIRGQGFLRNATNAITNAATSIGPFIINTANKIENAVGPTRIYNLGVNTLAQVPINAIGGHIMRHGLLPTNDESRLYYNVVRTNNFNNNNNRLEGYANTFLLGGFSTNNKFNDATELTNYIGGPSSVYGIGITAIRKPFDTITNNYVKISGSLDFSKIKTSNSYPSTVISNNAIITIENQSQNISFGQPSNLQQALSQFSIFQSSYSNTTDFVDAYSRSIRQFNTLITNQTITTRKRASNPPPQSNTSTTPSTQPSSTLSNVTVTSKDSYTLKSSSQIRGERTERTWRTREEMQDLLDKSFLRVTNPYTNFNTVSDEEGTTQQLPDRFLGASRLDSDVKSKSQSTSIFDYTAVKYSDSSPSNRKFSELKTAIDNVTDPSKQKERPTQFTNKNSELPKLENKNDTVSGSGPSSYPGTDATSVSNKDGVLELPALVFDYADPSLKKYSEIIGQIKTNISQSNFQTQDISVDRGNSTYQYNTGAKVTFNRTNDTDVNADEIKLNFTPYNPFTGTALTTLKFLAYITDYSDSFSSTWGDVKYVGRAEKFYIFNEFKRSVKLGFNIPCYNKQELSQKHTNLNTLVSILAGKYENNLLGGIITQLKVGNYVDNQFGIIDNLDFSIIDGSSWDLDDSLAFYIKVSFGFTVIHDFLPEYNKSFITV